MFHRWRLIEAAFPGSLVVLTGRPDPNRPWPYDFKDMDFNCVSAPETIHLSNHLAWSRGLVKYVQGVAGQKVIHLLETVSGLNALNIIMNARGNAFAMMSDGGFPETTKRISQKLRWELVGKQCVGTIVPGDAGRNYMSAWGFPSDKIYNSYLSHDVNAFIAYRDSETAKIDRKVLRSELLKNNQDVLMLCVSRLLDWKRLEDLADALQMQTNKTAERLVVVLIGDGPFRIPLSKFESLKNIRFKWIPAMPYEDVMKYYAASDFTILPSEGDIWGLVVNESLSMGKPVICTDQIGASELVIDGWNGFKTSKRNPKALADSIRDLTLDGQLRQSMSQNALTIEKTWHSGLYIEELKRLASNIDWDKVK